MFVGRGLQVLLVVGMIFGCTASGTFECRDDDACVVADVPGRCEANGYCSFPDDDCGSGRRFGDRAPNEIAGTCVPADDTSTGSNITSTSEPSSSGVMDDGGTGSSFGSSSTSDADTSSGSTTTGTNPNLEANYMFVSSTPLMPSESMVDDADALCNTLASDAGLPGTFVAWISDGTTNARDRLRLGNVLAQGWIRTDDRPFTNAIGDLVVGRIWFPPVLDETGTHVGSVPVATATSAQGTRSDACADWTDLTDAPRYQIGLSDNTFPRWTSSSLRRCNAPAHVYCFGVDRVETVVFEPPEGRLAFVSANTVSANAGLTGFDEECMATASGAGLAGEFMAVAATTEAPALARFDLSGQPWVNALGVPLTFENAPLSNVIRLDASVGYLVDGTATGSGYWAGSEDISLAATNRSCADWSMIDATANAWVSESAQTVDWFGALLGGCDGLRPVLCLEN